VGVARRDYESQFKEKSVPVNH